MKTSERAKALGIRIRTTSGSERVYTGNGWLLGKVGKLGNSWRCAASAYAFTPSRTYAHHVPVKLYRPRDPDIWLDGLYRTRHEAVDALIDHLTEKRAIALTRSKEN